MEGRERYVRYQQDRKILAAIGACLDPRVTRISVRLPRPIAESAVAAWNRDELDETTAETREEHDLRTDAAGSRSATCRVGPQFAEHSSESRPSMIRLDDKSQRSSQRTGT